jgi:hypothetical protein
LVLIYGFQFASMDELRAKAAATHARAVAAQERLRVAKEAHARMLELLGLKPGASSKAIKVAKKRLLRRWAVSGLRRSIQQ